MALNKPYHRIYRQLMPARNAGYSSWAFIVDKEYSVNPHHYTRPFLLLQEDIQNLFEYIEPADINLSTFSYRIHELLMRVCIEIEANFKAIFRENIYNPVFKNGPNIGQTRTEKDWNINDYVKINKSHRLSDYQVEFPIWRGSKNKYLPFATWQTKSSLIWYQAYNESKHDRNLKFEQANFENLINAYAGLFVLLSAQFNCESFMPGTGSLAAESDNYYKGEFGIGDYLIIEFPKSWNDSEKYDFDWSILKNEKNRFVKFDYDSI